MTALSIIRGPAGLDFWEWACRTRPRRPSPSANWGSDWRRVLPKDAGFGPLGGCRMADSPDLGVVDDTGAVYGYEGLYCIDGSIAPTSLGVNPSLTISALTERCAERLVARAGDLGLPTRPASLHPAVPPEHVGPRVMPARLHRQSHHRRSRHRRRRISAR